MITLANKIGRTMRELADNLYNVGVHPGLSEEHKRQLHLLNMMMSLGGMLIFGFMMLTFSLGFYFLMFVDFLLIVTASVGLVFHHLRAYGTARVLLFVVFPAQFLYYPVFVGDIGAEYYFLMFIIASFYCFSAPKQLIILNAYLIGIFVYAKYCIAMGGFPEYYKILETVHYYPSIIASGGFIVLVVAMFKSDTSKTQATLLEELRLLNAESDITETQLEFNKTVYRELNHRVKNNLQLISGLFAMQTYQTEDADVRNALVNARTRVDTVAYLCRQLYGSSVLQQPDIGRYTEEAVNYAKENAESQFQTEVQFYSNSVSYLASIDICVNYGLLLNEVLAFLCRLLNEHEHELLLRLKFYVQNTELSCEISSVADTSDLSMHGHSASHKQIDHLADMMGGRICWKPDDLHLVAFTVRLGTCPSAHP